jgi:hypothetical protein
MFFVYKERNKKEYNYLIDRHNAHKLKHFFLRCADILITS